jgi:hypothetical protein
MIVLGWDMSLPGFGMIDSLRELLVEELDFWTENFWEEVPISEPPVKRGVGVRLCQPGPQEKGLFIF